MDITIIYLIMNLIRTFAIYGFIDNFLKNKRFPAWSFCLGYGIYYVVVSYIYLKESTLNPLHNIIINLLLTFFIGCLLYKSSFQKLLLSTVFISILSISSEDCTIVILTILFETALTAMLNSSHLTMIGMVISMSLLYAITKLVEPLFKRQIMEFNRLYWFALFTIPSGCIYITHSLVKQLEIVKGNERFVCVTILILFAFNILIFYLYDNLLKESETKYENLLLVQQNEAYKKHALLIQDFQAGLRIQQHDLHNHIIAVTKLVEYQQTEKLLAYLNQWSQDIIPSEPGIQTKNVIVNALINSKIYIANQQSTTFYATVDIPSELSVSDTDLTVILGNLLDNVLEACVQLPPEERAVHCILCHEHNTLTVTVINTYDKSRINMRDGIPITTKNDTESHGIGIKRIKQTVEKNNGFFECKTSEINGKDIFISHVLLYTH